MFALTTWFCFIFVLNRVSFRRKKKDEKSKDGKEDPKAKEGPKKKGAEEVRDPKSKSIIVLKASFRGSLIYPTWIYTF